MKPIASSLTSLQQARAQALADGRGRHFHEALWDDVRAASDTAAAAHVFTQRWDDSARAAAQAADTRSAAGQAHPVLDGWPVTVKDLFDVAGTPTWAGSRVRQTAAPAEADAPAVARLRAAGALITGKTNMTEFAFSGVGLNPHFGTPRNPCDRAVARIPGGSSAGAAVSVALGLAVAGLGSDTGGSIRIPAALCGLVGFKSTQSRVPLDGAFPLSPTLDTVCAVTRCVADSLIVDGVLSGAALAVAPRPLQGCRLLLPQTVVLDQLEPAVARAFARALSALSAQGAQLVEAPLPALAEVAHLHTPGGFSAVEAYALHRDTLDSQRAHYDPRVAARIDLGRTVSAADYLRLHTRRRDWIQRVEGELQPFDAVVCPTVPLVAPPIAVLRDDDEAFFRTNGLLLRNTFLFNYLDGCAFSLPCQAEGDLPVGLMLAACRGQDAALARVALAVEACLQAAGLGATGAAG